MADVAQSVDEKLAAAARRNHALADERRARGEATARDVARDRIRVEVVEQLEGARRSHDARIPEHDGDRPAPTPSSAQLLIPPRFQLASFDNFAPKTRSQRVALDNVREWTVRATKKQGPMLALIGEQGAGKSHLLYAATSCVIESNPGFVYARGWYRLADELRYGGRCVFAPQHFDEAHEVRTRLWSHPIVLIDEVRATASTALDENELAKFACHAYDSRFAVLITTNVDPLSDVMGAAAASRFTQLVIEGPDHRQAS